MKVKAKWAVKAGGKWHNAGEIFEVDSIAGLKDVVEVIPEEKPAKVPQEEVKVETPETEPAAAEAGPAEKPRTATRTRKTTRK